MERRSRLIPDRHDDPIEAMANLFDVALLIGIGFLIVALTGFGLREMISSEDVTIVKNPGGKNMELITKRGRSIERLKATGATGQGVGVQVGAVYRLEDGTLIWVPSESVK